MFLALSFFSIISVVLTQQLPLGSSSYQVISPANNKPIAVSTHVPAGVTKNSTIVIVMHGAGDNGSGMRNAWVSLSNQYKFIILAPYFNTQWYGTYQLAGLDGPTSDYEIDSLDLVFDEAKKRLNSTVSKYYLYGMSAGCQYVHRASTFTSSQKIKAVVCASAGFYTFPTEMQMYPYGLLWAGAEPKLAKHFCRNTFMIVGGADNTRDSALLMSPEADAEGLTRLARAQNYFTSSKTTATQMGLIFNWRFYVLPGVTHDNGPLAVFAAAEFAKWDQTGVTETCAAATTTTPPPTTTTTTTLPSTVAPNPCNGPLDIVFVIDGSDTMTAARFNTTKAQIAAAINQNGISWGPNAAHVGIVISTGLFAGGSTTPYRHLDLEGCQYYAETCTNPTVNSTATLLAAVNGMTFHGGKNDIALSMSETLTGEYEGLPDSWYIFGGPIWGSAGDRPSVPNVMIIISGADNSNVAPARDALLAQGVTVFAVGLSDLAPAQVEAITGNSANSFSSAPAALASAISNVCHQIGSTTTTKAPTTSTTTTVPPATPVWSEWTASSCSADCGLCGRRVMTRTCQGGTTCPGANNMTSTEICGTAGVCPFGLGLPSCCAPAQRAIVNAAFTCVINTTTAKPLPAITTCAGSIDLVFIIDGSDTMTAARFATIKTQLASAITQSNITWGDTKAHVGIVLSTGLMKNGATTPYRHLDLNGCQYYADGCTPTITTTPTLLTAINNMQYTGGKNNIALSMTETLTGELEGLPDSWYIFGEPYWGTLGDRPAVPDVVIVISGADISNVAPARDLLLARGIRVYSIGFSDLPTAQLQAISGNPARSFSVAPTDLAATIKNICQFKA